MNQQQQLTVNLRSWAEGDLPLLTRLMGDPEMMTFLGGPETAEKIQSRHERYCQIAQTGKGYMFVITAGEGDVAVGSVGYWEIEGNDQLAWETGWSVLPEFQGQGIATQGTLLAVEHARAEQKHRFIHAFPSVKHGASNAICRKAGFTLQGEVEFEDRTSPGNFLRFNDWSLDLFAAAV